MTATTCHCPTGKQHVDGCFMSAHPAIKRMNICREDGHSHDCTKEPYLCHAALCQFEGCGEPRDSFLHDHITASPAHEPQPGCHAFVAAPAPAPSPEPQGSEGREEWTLRFHDNRRIGLCLLKSCDEDHISVLVVPKSLLAVAEAKIKEWERECDKHAKECAEALRVERERADYWMRYSQTSLDEKAALRERADLAEGVWEEHLKATDCLTYKNKLADSERRVKEATMKECADHGCMWCGARLASPATTGKE